jgi:hypothetical protein
MGKYLFSKGAALTIGAAMIFGFANQAGAVPVYGLTNTNGLMQWDSATPQDISLAIDNIGGLVANDDIIGIDFRPADGFLYGVGTGGGAAGSARVYTINTLTGVATLVSTMDTSLNGSRFGFDFNPVADRLRITSNADQNLRVNVATGATVIDTPLSYQAGDVFFGQNPNVIASAYTNDFAGAASTQLYGIDSIRNSLVLQVSPNGGTLQTIGLLGVDVSQLSGFDIYFDPTTQTNIGFASLQNIAEGVSRFYTINLTNGQATAVGLEQGDLIDGIAVGIAVPEPSSVALLGLAALALGGVKWARRRHA